MFAIQHLNGNNMRSHLLTYCLFGLLLCCCVFSSCTKEDMVLVEEKEEPIITGISLRINNQTFTTDAFASYCSDGDKEFLSVSNKEVLLDTILNVMDFEEDDFVFNYGRQVGTPAFAYGGAVFGESVTGLPGLQIVFSEVEVTVDSNDGTVVTGTMEGSFAVFDFMTGSTFDLPFSVIFSALIVSESTFCD